MGLVEVVEIHHEFTLGRSVETEVPEVRVAADHWGDPGGRQPGDVCGHHDGGAAQDPVRRVDHPADPDRDEFVQSTPVWLLDQLDWVAPTDGCTPSPQGRAGHLLTQCSAKSESFAPRRRSPPERAKRLVLGHGQDGVLSRAPGHNVTSSARRVSFYQSPCCWSHDKWTGPWSSHHLWLRRTCPRE